MAVAAAPTDIETHQRSAPARSDAWFPRLAAFSARRRRLVIGLWLLVTLAAAPLAITLNGALSGAGWEAQGSTAQQVRDELRRDFPALGAENPVVVYRQPTPITQDPAGLRALVAALGHAPRATSVADPLTLPATAGLVSRDGRSAIIPVAQAAASDAQRPEAAGELGRYVASLHLADGTRAEVTGEWPVWSDFNHINEQALHKAELLSGLPSLILLFVAFGMLLAAGLPLLLAVAGIAVGFASLHLLTALTPLSVWSMNFSMMIGLAVGIDYSLFIVSRYREERAEGNDASTAIENTLATAGKAVFLSALTVVLSLAAVYLVPVMVFRSMALGMILSVVAVAAAALTLLPAVLVALGDRVLLTKNAPDPDAAAETRWRRWTAQSLRRPGTVLAVGLAVLGGLVAPALGMHLGMPSAHVVDRGHTSRDGYDMLTSAFGPGAAAPVFITTPAGTADHVLGIARHQAGVIDAQVVTPPASTGRVVVRVTGSTPVDDSRTGALVAGLRHDIGAAVPDARVGGPAAQNHDLTNALTGRAPFAIALILLLAFGLLLVVFRSLAIAVVSILLNLLTVGAAFGFATLVFQHGIGAAVLGIEHQQFVDAWAPLFFFALLFGLSMDYQLFLLAAIRERYEATGDTRSAIQDGIARTGRPITNAALVMIVVFVAFGITGPIPPTELGVTLAMAVLLDATVVRVLLVPAVMALMGERNWYLPRWLDRALPHIHFTH
ncbi:MAG TPA: MMPL family transporter [Acidimicrobiales bacterium]|nr:MMPL family transporter [Acidimicrobiales bacterium]